MDDAGFMFFADTGEFEQLQGVVVFVTGIEQGEVLGGWLDERVFAE